MANHWKLTDVLIAADLCVLVAGVNIQIYVRLKKNILKRERNKMIDDFYNKEQIIMLVDLAEKSNEKQEADDIHFIERKMFEAFRIGRAFQEVFHEREMSDFANETFPDKRPKKKLTI